METLYIKFNISKSDVETDAIRNNGLFFEYIANAVELNRCNIEEIDKNNYLSEIKNIYDKHSK